ncbi:WD repeat-containing protein 27 [Denticeps clupeoides]|nr:WD repeat-containing protein 27 [Denticeps clupeoides]
MAFHGDKGLVSIKELFCAACAPSASHVQLGCCRGYAAVPRRGGNLTLYSENGSGQTLALSGHHGNVTAVAFGRVADPLLLCSASEGCAMVWDVERCYRTSSEGQMASGTVVGTLLGKVVYLSFCPTDERVAACSGNKIYVLNSKKEQVHAVLQGHLGPPIATEFCPWDTGVLVSISEDRTFMIWDLSKKQVLYQSAVLSSCPLISILLMEHSRQLITGSSNGQVWCHSLPDDYKCRLVTRLDIHKTQKMLERLGILNGEQQNTVEAAKPVLTITPGLPFLGKESCWIGSCDGLYLVDLASSEILTVLHFKDYSDLNISLAESLVISQEKSEKMHCLVTSMFEPKIALWEIGFPEKLEKTFPEHHLSVVACSPLMPTSVLKAELAKTDPKSPKKAGVHKQGGVKDHAVVFHTQVKSSGYGESSRRKMFMPMSNIKKKPQKSSWTTKKTGFLLSEYPSHLVPSAPHSEVIISAASPTPIFSLQYSGDGKQILCGLGDRSVLLYKSSLNGNPSVYTGHNKAVSSVCWSHSRSCFLSASEDQTLYIWTPGNKEPALIMGCDKFSTPIQATQFYFLDKFIMLASGSCLHLYLYHLDTSRDDIKRYKQKSFSKLAGRFSTRSGTDISAMTAANDFYSHIVLACGVDRSIQIFDMNVGCVALEISEAHNRAIHHITQNKGSMFSTQTQDSYNLFLSSAITDGIKLWDLRSSRCVRRYEGHLNRCYQCTAAFSPCGRYVATGSEDNCAYVYDIRSSSYLHKLQRQTDVVLNVAFNPATPELLAGTLDGKLSLFWPASGAGLP